MTPPSTQRRPSPRPAKTRRAILGAAHDLFAKSGGVRPTIDEVAQAAGVSVGSIYVHFKSREGMWLALADAELEQGQDELAAARIADSPLQRLIDAGRAYVGFAGRYRSAFHFASSAELSSATDGGGAQERVAQIVATISDDLEVGMQRGEITPFPLREATALVWGTWNGVTGNVLRRDALAITEEEAIESLALWSKLLVAQPA